MVRKESLQPISNSSDYQGCRCGDLQLQLKPALNLETEDKSGLPQKDTDAQGLYTWPRAITSSAAQTQSSTDCLPGCQPHSTHQHYSAKKKLSDQPCTTVRSPSGMGKRGPSSQTSPPARPAHRPLPQKLLGEGGRLPHQAQGLGQHSPPLRGREEDLKPSTA